MVELFALLVQPPLHLLQVRLEVRARLLQLPDQPLQLRLGQILPVQGQRVGQRVLLLILNLQLNLQQFKTIGKMKKDNLMVVAVVTLPALVRVPATASAPAAGR